MKIFDNITKNLKIFKKSAENSTKGIKGMFEEAKNFDFKKMPKTGYIYLGICVLMFIFFVVIAFLKTR